MGNLILLSVISLLLQKLDCIMLKKECPPTETHKSCSFFEEYTCWEDEYKRKRVMTLPSRLSHCKSGCFCKKGSVRSYPEGDCILAFSCKDQRIESVLNALPS